MATVNKDFRVKHGLVVEGTTGTINGSNILTEAATEFLQDTIGAMVSGNTEGNITVEYDDANGKLNFSVPTLDTESVQDIIGGMVSTNTESGITVEYDDVNGKLNFSVTEQSLDTEGVQDIIGAMVSSNTESGITVEYDDTSGKLNFSVATQLSNTDGLTEGSTNKYFTDERAQDAIGNAVGTGLTYNDTTGAISVTANTYDAYGSASAVAGNLSTHTSATEAHGATGAVVGTTNTQTLTNKTLTSPKINEDVALTATATELNVLDGITSSTAELNILDGVTSTAAELNILDGVTATTTELNYVDGVTSAIQTQLDGKLDESGGSMTGALAMGTNKITGLGAPTQSDDAATKAYVDAAVEGLHVHEAVRVAVDGNIAIATALENGDSAGGVTLATGDRVLLKDQTNTAENGIYVVQASGQAIRALDFDTAAEIDSGDFVFVSAGTYANTGWVQTLKPATIGTDPLQFTQFSGAGTFTAGTGLDLNGTEFVLDLSEVDTSTLPEGTNKYYTDERVDDRVDGLLVGGTGISKTYNDSSNSLTLAVDFTEFSTTDISEGTKLFFTNQRAVDALQAVVPDFTEIEVNNIARQVAATVSAPTAATAVTAFAFAKATYRSAKFLVKVAYGSHTEVSEILLTLDTSDNIAITEYAVVGTNGSASGISADIDGTNVRLRVTPVNASSTVSVFGTLIV